jgi:hypothetical protein
MLRKHRSLEWLHSPDTFVTVAGYRAGLCVAAAWRTLLYVYRILPTCKTFCFIKYFSSAGLHLRNQRGLSEPELMDDGCCAADCSSQSQKDVSFSCLFSFLFIKKREKRVQKQVKSSPLSPLALPRVSKRDSAKDCQREGLQNHAQHPRGRRCREGRWRTSRNEQSTSRAC